MLALEDLRSVLVQTLNIPVYFTSVKYMRVINMADDRANENQQII